MRKWRDIKEYIQWKWRIWILSVVTIGVLMLIAYYGTYQWLQYANSEAFKGEVNAAIITGIVGIITLLGTMGLTAYWNLRSQRMTIRDELFKRKMEVYLEILDILEEIDEGIWDFFIRVGPTEELEMKFNDLRKQLIRIRKKNQYCMSHEVQRQVLYLYADLSYITTKNAEREGIHQVIHNLLEVDWIKKNNEKRWNLSIDPNRIIFAGDLATTFRNHYCGKLYSQIYKELGLKSVQKELENLRY